jgi:protein involved in polysaccharide export with SLBB domain
MLVSTMMAGAWPVAAQEHVAAEYRLGAGDRLQIRTFNREDLSGAFEVRPPGTISFPLIGTIDVLGLTPTELERKIGERLASEYRVTASVNVEVSIYRPFYIMGDVMNPGKYPYSPGISILQAVAMAGGYYSLHPAEISAQLSAIQAEENYNIYTIQERAAMMRRARLLAEREQRPDVSIPNELLALEAEADVKAALSTEQQLFAARQERLRSEIALREAQIESYNKEITALQATIAATNEQQRLLDLELKDAEGLLAKGLTQRPRVLELQRVAAALDGEESEDRAYLARAEQNIGKIEEEIAGRRSLFREEVEQMLVETERELRELAEHRSAARNMIIATHRGQPPVQADQLIDERARFVIRRPTTTGLVQIDATETSLVLPDDIIVVPTLVEAASARPSIDAGHVVPDQSQVSPPSVGLPPM